MAESWTPDPANLETFSHVLSASMSSDGNARAGALEQLDIAKASIFGESNAHRVLLKVTLY